MKWAFFIPPNLVDETLIGSDKSATVLNRQSQQTQSYAGWYLSGSSYLPCNLNGSHRLKSSSYQIRNLKNLLTGSSPDHHLLRFLKAIANH